MLSPEEVSPDAVADAVVRLLREPSYTTSAEAIAGEIAAMPTADEVLPALVGESTVE